MRMSRFLSLACGVILCAQAGSALAQMKVGVISSATGPISVVGIPQKNTVALLPKEVGGISIEYIALDDASDPTQTVQHIKKLLTEDKVDAVIGPSGSANAVSVIGFMAEAGTPLLAPVGTTAVVLPMDEKKKWVFKTTQNDDLIAAALIDHMKATNIKSVGLIATNDPYGENWVKAFSALAAKAGIALTGIEYFQRADTSTTAQCLKTVSANPDAILIATAGAATVLPEATLADLGFKGKIYQTHGAASPDFLKLGGAKVEGTILAASLMLVIDQIDDSNPVKKTALAYIDAYKKIYGAAPATFGANVYDAGLLLANAIPTAAKSAKPGTPEFRKALRDALEQTKELVGTQGVYNMTPQDHSGFDSRGRELITVKNGAWQLMH
jgi:branched-chain amino acid transport system substrate-binding protein